jgi:hypothetical protein
MSQIVLIATFVMLFTIKFLAFGMQRATLLISRESGVPPKFSALLLPAWYPAVWLVIAAKWGTLLLIALNWSWWIAGALALVELFLSSILPIPYKAYIPSFRRRVEQHKNSDPALGKALEAMLNSSRIH